MRKDIGHEASAVMTLPAAERVLSARASLFPGVPVLGEVLEMDPGIHGRDPPTESMAIIY